MRPSKRSLLGSVLALTLGAVLYGPAAAQDYPTQSITLIVPFSTGGGVDTLARVIAPELSKEFGQSVVVENREGASGIIGTGMVATANPDGYTIALVSSSHASNPSLYKDLPYDTLKDLTTVTVLASAPGLLVVSPSVPVTTVQELIELAKSKPGELSYAHGGKGTSPHLAAELFKVATGVDIFDVPYKGIGPAFPDLISGRVSMSFPPLSVALQYVQSGQLKALGVTSATRTAIAPDIPTIAESGVEGFDASTWYGIVAPANTPPAVVEKLQQTIAKVLRSPEVAKVLTGQGLDVVANTPAEATALVTAQVNKWKDVVKAAGIAAE